MLDVAAIEWNAPMRYAMDIMLETHTSIFITGSAGTGKSTLLRAFLQETDKKVAVLAPTGIAALHVGGQTIHSFFGLPARPINQREIRRYPEEKRQLFENLDTIIIDEVSMVRADLLDNIDYFLRLNGPSRHLPFGGIQMVFIGDLYQLPPIISSEEEQHLFDFMYTTPFFFSAAVINNMDIEYVELDKVYRQRDDFFIEILQHVRKGTLNSNGLLYLNQRCSATYMPQADDLYITLCTTNRVAQRINEQKLALLETETFTYRGEITGSFSQKNLPTDEVLHLKQGAQVMFVKNDALMRWVNGTMGTIVALNDDEITVEIQNAGGLRGKNLPPLKVKVEMEEWDMINYVWDEAEAQIKSEVVGTFMQFPLKLAWAITIHKSQGKTFEHVIIDLGRGAFAAGQVYVALSRCTGIRGLILRRPLRAKDIIVDQRVVNFKPK